VAAIILLILRILMAALLYGFLGLAIYTLMRDLQQQGQLLIARVPPALTLTSLADYNPASQRYTKTVVILGRDAACDYPIDDQTISSKHAQLSFHHQQWWLEDLRSTNGTYLNDETVTSPVVVTNGDRLRLGHLGVKVEIGKTDSDDST
jgi:pSer/pThr/pTyr-binding forkhead associated (FHA) protein